jgi:HAD superfamily hydrolase (TIGR01509 family)
MQQIADTQYIAKVRESLRGALLDVDETLVASEELHFFENQKYFKRYGLDLTREDHIHYWVNGPGTAGLIKDHNIDLNLADVKSEKQKIFLDMLGQIKPKKGAMEFLHYLISKGLYRAAVSSGFRESVEKELEICSMLYYMNAIISKEDVMHEKPNPEPYIKGADALGLDPQNCVCVEDSPNGVMSAKRANVGLIIACPSEWTKGLDFSREAEPHIVVASLEEIVRSNLL